jgi:hypothetical protein
VLAVDYAAMVAQIVGPAMTMHDMHPVPLMLACHFMVAMALVVTIAFC